ncbi:PLC-like phosphodiesterase [Dacryopinax primogenitus]|uniref:PLC-like phosphodiesterase n=1 Tax=Dacryopinax primogenitus (strain DJM 731) TaxID=1858805 RepID=M5FWF5_DACPD|nr:PLC-like phosphodiesterase [Dacryopinax primogenitus]EJU00025.1 PLC-like phosphodiesterase [Dacryopinax primogenitus]
MRLPCMSLLLLPFLTLSLAAPNRRATTCNGSPLLCSRQYSNITFIGAHDSFALSPSLAGNQDYDLTQQLTDGIRMLQNQAHSANNTIELCHTSCSLLDGGSLAIYLGKLKVWLDANPGEVVTLLLVNNDDLPVSQFGAVLQSVGLDTVSFNPGKASLTLQEWPTLGQMLDQGTRLVTFMDTNADFQSVPYILDEFSNMWETAFDVTTTFDCVVNRTHGDPTTQLSTINHFLDIGTTIAGIGITMPDKPALPQTNAVSGPNSLGAQAQECVAENGRAPNFLLVDYYEVGGGSVFEVAAELNGIPYSQGVIASVPGTAGGTGTGGTGTGGTATTLAGGRETSLGGFLPR